MRVMEVENSPFVRQYKIADYSKVMRVCQKTAAPDLLKEPAISIAPYIWCVPYTRLQPEHCFVVDDGKEGLAVGYILCAPNTQAFVKNYEAKYIPILKTLDSKLEKPEMEPPANWKKELPKALLQLLYSPEQNMMHSDYPNLIKKYPAHLHIDILPEFQRHGLGTDLMNTLLTKLEDEKVKGIHLVMDGKNTGAEKFYLAVGFMRFPEIIDDGKSGELGKDKGGSLWMVKGISS